MATNEAYWRMQDQTRVKHAILQRYLREWAAILGRYNRVLRYIDTHAGKGRYDKGEPGSPLIAMQLGQELSDFLSAQGVECVFDCQFVESNRTYYESLQAEVKAVEVQYPAVQWKGYPGTFQDWTPRILADIPNDSATFIFVDPFGYNDVEMAQMLPLLTKGRKHELFINVMSDFVNRFLNDPHKHPALDRLFGTPKWRELLEEERDREKKLVMLYASQLSLMAAEQLGRNVWAHPVRVTLETGKSPFYLIHVSQNSKARFVMERAARKAGPNQILHESEATLSLEQIKQLLSESSERRRQAKAIDLAGDVWQIDVRVSWVDGIRVALKQLHEQDYVRIERNGSPMRKTNIPSDNDTVHTTGRQYSPLNSLGL